MKRRTFLTTLLLFLLTINLGIMLIGIYTYRDTVEQARGRAAAEHYFIASGILGDIAALDGRGVSYSQGIIDLAAPYAAIAENGQAGFVLYDGDTPVYSNIREEHILDFPSLPQNEVRIISVKNIDTDAAIFVSGRLPKPYDNYVLIYRYDFSDALQRWHSMKNTMFTIGLILSGVLAVCLLFLLESLFHPLTEISKISRGIAGGEYSTRLTIKGKDELAEMAENFNHMAGEIERQIEELVTASENKQLFIDNFAHELKTPLTAIYGYAEYLQRASVSEDDRYFALDCIMSESSRIQTMAYQMMELANLRNDQINMEYISAPEFLQKVKCTMMPRAKEKDIDLLLYCDLPKLYGNSNLLESLLINLIDNAIKASNIGSPILVKAFSETDGSIIIVEDKGKGMSKEALSHVTQPYYRVEKHRNRGDGGAGLGLAICEQIAVRHKAKLSFVSNPGNGTTAKITFTTS